MAARRLAACAWTWGVLAGLMVAMVAQPSAAAEQIKIGVVKGVGIPGPVLIASERGYFTSEGLAAEIVYLETGPAIALATASGTIDFGCSAMSAALYALSAQGVLRIIGGAAREVPGFQIAGFVVSNRSYAAGLRSFKDLPGHSVAMGVIGSNYHYNIARLAEKYDFPLSSLRLLPLQNLSLIASAVAGGTADAGMQNPTGTISLVQHGDAKLLGWIGDEVPYQSGVLWTTTANARNRQITVERFLRAFRRGARDYHDAFTGPDEQRIDGPAAPSVLAVLGKFVGQTPDQVRTAIGYVDPEARLDVKDVLHQIAWYKAQGMLKGEVDTDAIIDKRYVIPLPER